MRALTSCLILIGILFSICANAQHIDHIDSIPKFPSQYIDQISDKLSKIENRIDKRSGKVISQLQKQEKRLKKKLAKIDSIGAQKIFADAREKYDQLNQKISSTRKLSQYIPKLDTIAGSLKFLEQNKQLLSHVKDAEKLKQSLSKVSELESSIQKAEDIRKFLKERKEYLKAQFQKLGFSKQLKKISKQTYYYGQQLNEYKNMLKDSKKREKKALEMLTKTKLFKDFMRKNSMLASLFGFPDDVNDPSSQRSLAGLQTRAQVTNLIQQQISSGGPDARRIVQQNIEQAKSQLNELKSKVDKFGGNNSEVEIPDFKPNSQRTKSFWKRWELGTNLQTQKANNFFPITTDLGLSAGFKLNDKSIIGVGASYKLGFGKGWNSMKLTQEGVGLRSFVDMKLKRSFWISGGFEMNYRTVFNSLDQLQHLNAWQQSGLLGLSKVVTLKNKFLKKTKLQLLWDFLSYNQKPVTQPLVFRVGYNF